MVICVPAVFSLIYMALVLVLFVFAVLNLFASFNIIKSGQEKIYRVTVNLLLCAPLLLALVYISYSMAYDGLFSSNTTYLSWSAIITMVCYIVVISAIVITKIVSNKQRSVKALVKCGITLAVSIVALCLVFAPVMTTTAEIVPSGSEEMREFDFNVYAAPFYQISALGEEYWDSVNALNYTTFTGEGEIIDADFELFSIYSRKELRSEQGINANHTFLTSMYNTVYENYMVIFAIVLNVGTLLSVIGILFVIWQMLRYLVFEKHSRTIIVLGKIFSAVFAAVALGIVIALVCMGMYIVNMYMSINIYYIVYISAGIIVFAVFAIGLIFCPMPIKRIKKNRKIEPQLIEETTSM